MYELTVERVFSAAHAIRIQDHVEPVHGHNWYVRLAVRSRELDRNGLVCDFHLLERRLDDVIGRWHNQHLNNVTPFDHINPTAEHVARAIADAITSHLPAPVRLHWVSVTEAPGCVATYFPD